MSHSKRSSPTANKPQPTLPTPLQGVLSAAVLATPTGIVICDPKLPDCPIIYANAAFYRITGYTEEEVIGRNCRFLQGPGTNPRHIKALREAIENGKATTEPAIATRSTASLAPRAASRSTHQPPARMPDVLNTSRTPPYTAPTRAMPQSCTRMKKAGAQDR